MAQQQNRIKQLRIAKGMTQQKLASELKVSQNAVYNWENGKRQPKIDTLYKIAKILKVEFDELVESSVDADISIGSEIRATDFEFLQSLVEHNVFDDDERKIIHEKILQFEKYINQLEDREKVIKYGKKSQKELTDMILKMLLSKVESDKISDIIILLSFFIGLSERNQSHIITFLVDNIY